MKRIEFLCVAAVFLLTGPVGADLVVQDYLGNGEKVTLDTATGHHWYWNSEDFVSKTYDEQITAIGGLGTYGNIAGGWHMASESEMLTLFPYAGQTIVSSFDWPPDPHPGTSYLLWGRYDVISYFDPDSHYSVIVLDDGFLTPLHTNYISDSYLHPLVGAWVTTDAAVVPAPGALVLAATGLLSVLGVNRWRRKS